MSSLPFTADRLSQPKKGHFATHDIQWYPTADSTTARREPAFNLQDQAAFIPRSRLDDFIAGVSAAGCCSFNKPYKCGAGKYILESATYQCCHGPADDRHFNAENSSAAANGQEPERFGKRSRGDGCKTGCLTKFRCFTTREEPHVTQIQWLGPEEHRDCRGQLCHGPGCEEAQGTRHATYQRLSTECHDWVDNMVVHKASPSS